MPIEIREIYVKINVNGEGNNAPTDNADGDKKEKLIKKSLEQMQQREKRKKER